MGCFGSSQVKAGGFGDLIKLHPTLQRIVRTVACLVSARDCLKKRNPWRGQSNSRLVRSSVLKKRFALLVHAIARAFQQGYAFIQLSFLDISAAKGGGCQQKRQIIFTFDR